MRPWSLCGACLGSCFTTRERRSGDGARIARSIKCESMQGVCLIRAEESSLSRPLLISAKVIICTRQLSSRYSYRSRHDDSHSKKYLAGTATMTVRATSYGFHFTNTFDPSARHDDAFELPHQPSSSFADLCALSAVKSVCSYLRLLGQ